jgi:hypothetical protein
MIKKILIILLIAVTLMGYNNRMIVGGSAWAATDTNQTDTTGLKLDRSFETQILMYMFDVRDTIPSTPDTFGFALEDPDSFVFTLEGWITDTLLTYTKYTIIADTVTIPADTFIGFDTIPNWYIQMCDTFLFLQQTLDDTLGFEGDTTLVTPYLNRIR